ncbi:limb region 1 protein homolog isoform X2 [Carassius auratus]|uniref:Limb region 1 protein homolog isoform X2 n=1 Tax=Carassius auratus TaxID=7957 RepID=A0A6P6KGF3_CARAU|nr:limb region 1 protein homolog isoform X2 [Carassius auratus]XP_052457507.1 limb region 1 protein homolog isoform X1 [Carassius gibelio]
MEEDDVTIREQNFHSQVREYIICFLLFAVLYIVSYCIISRYKRKSDDQEDEDAIVNRISMYLCTFTLAVSGGAVLLLPFSIISYEILLSLPKNYYIQWLNGSLIHGLWNLVSLFSNLCLFVLMPFAYFFLESEGFAGSKKGIKSRVLETFVMLFLLGLLILGIVWVASALIDNDAASMESLYDLWEFYLPYLYSCISLMGGLLLLMCTPVGLSRMFTVMGQLLVKPTILEDLDEQIYCIQLQEEALERRLNGTNSSFHGNSQLHLYKELDNIRNQRNKLERRKKASAWEKNLLYPIVMLILLAGTAISVLLVALNIVYLLVDETALPKGSTVRNMQVNKLEKERDLGNASLSTFGVAQAVIEIVLMFYLLVSSVVGFYSLRIFQELTPRKDDTTMTTIIGCCVSILVLSSALPVMSRTLGITRFDLLGDFGRFNWLGNFYIVLSYNLLFAVVTTLCLVRKFTSAVREELLKALGLDKLNLSNSTTDAESGKHAVNGHQKTL